MQLDIYWTPLLVLLPTVIILTSRNIIIRPLARIQSRWQKIDTDEKTDSSLPQPADEAGPASGNDDLRRFRRSFLSIYLLVMSSEWLSGPYLYALLRDDRKLPESVVVGLYATAYTSAAISALGVGFLADRYGRRKACLAQCVIHACACLTIVLGNDCLPVLFLGRVLAGTALTLLWTVFESWMVTEWNARGLDQTGVEGGHGGLSEMFGVMTTTNCMAAIVGGLFGHCMVSALGSKMWPFWAGIVLEGVAAVLMLKRWNENFGVKQQPGENDQESTAPDGGASGTRWLGDGRIWALTFVTCCFEGTAFLVIFLWPSVLQSAHEAASADAITVEIPYGVIFGSFMAAMIIGALFFSASSKSIKTQMTPVWLLLSAILLACISLWLLAVLKVEVPLYYAFLVFEVANDGLMKIPLFIFVILALGITAEGKRFRCYVFASASISLLLAAVALLIGFWECPGRPDGAGYILQRGFERGEAANVESESRGDPEVHIREGEGILCKGPDVS
ncbi:hypothetical protein Daus18300_005258 [Diaporthe australafricana]|uniref:Molybdate-anion transporter n=1 Tax=Diaporthe australafricana TaxID=127596 RepID=A0ABR3X369_9PEZI